MTCTSVVTHLELALDDVPAGARFFRQVLALPVREHDEDHAEVRLADDLVAHLRTATDLACAGPTAACRPRRTGPILEVRVPAVRPALAELRRRGATVLIDQVLTDWGTESAFLAGPEDMVIEVYRPVEA